MTKKIGLLCSRLASDRRSAYSPNVASFKAKIYFDPCVFPEGSANKKNFRTHFITAILVSYQIKCPEFYWPSYPSINVSDYLLTSAIGFLDMVFSV